MNSSYEVIEKRSIKDLNSEGTILRHKKTGARVVLLSNDDENKVFYIAFRTPPVDSTGVPHILEHSVLCGSKKYPAKDPFVELCKGSLNTFLNAMTYPDKTVYPVASCNDKDFQNLVDVYMDSVFNPNIYEREQIFKQEGWRYELFDKNDDIKINGVVYNEMKGAFSSPDDMLEREILNSLYPDTQYGVESGGDPDVIPELTYEAFLDFHRKYYHPSNSYIYIYGNCDMDEKLEYLDKEYLSKYDYLDVDSTLADQNAFGEVRKVEKEYSITQEETEEDNTFLSLNYVLDTSLIKELYLAFQILDYCLIGAPGAIITESLLKAGILEDIDSLYENGIKQTYYSFVGKKSNKESLDEFVHIITDELKKASTEGINKDTLRAAINIFEFRYREADFGRYPKGLMYGLQALDSWLYDDKAPFMHIEANDTFKFLKDMVETDYYEKLIEKYLLNNTHSSIVVMSPKKGLTTIKDKELSDKLAEYKASLSDKELDELVDSSKALKQYQEEPSTDEELESIPLLQISDIKREARKRIFEKTEVDGVELITHDIFTNGIGYVNLYFDITSVPDEYLPYAGILANVLGFLNTKDNTYAELANKINISTGGMSSSISNVADSIDLEKYTLLFKVRTKLLYDKLPVAFDLMKELVLSTDFSDYDRMLELLQMIKSRYQSTVMQAGHSAAMKRALSYKFESARKDELYSGYEFYKEITRVIDNYDDEKEQLKQKLEDLCAYIFTKDNLLVDFISEKKAENDIKAIVPGFANELSKADVILSSDKKNERKKNEGLKTGAKVQYVAKAGSFADKGFEYTGALKVLKVIMGYDYLWNNVRVKGGAYGCMSGFMQNGRSYFVSYRDPNLKETLDIFDGAPKYLREFNASERDMTKYIIGTIADIDTPLTPYDEGMSGFDMCFTHRTMDMVQKSRDEVLDCTVDDIRKLADYIDAVLSDECICVVGNEDKIEENKDLFEVIEDFN